MAALHRWLARWLPIQIHRLTLAQVDRNQIEAAAGVDTDELQRLWRNWPKRKGRCTTTASPTD